MLDKTDKLGAQVCSSEEGADSRGPKLFGRAGGETERDTSLQVQDLTSTVRGGEAPPPGNKKVAVTCRRWYHLPCYPVPSTRGSIGSMSQPAHGLRDMVYVCTTVALWHALGTLAVSLAVASPHGLAAPTTRATREFAKDTLVPDDGCGGEPLPMPIPMPMISCHHAHMYWLTFVLSPDRVRNPVPD